ncbi:MAG: hypothetical protein PHC61_09800 [Chitinivibrionales bacterium]|nr:hypothetical protein [Chitinivibrionales bacterium]
MGHRISKVFQRTKNNLVYFIVRILLMVEPLIPRRCGLTLFGLLGRLVFLFPSADKRVAIAQLQDYFSAQGRSDDAAKSAATMYANLGKNGFDALRLGHSSDRYFDRIVSWEGLAEFSEAYAGGKGVIVITAHLGCFEMLLNFFGRKGFTSFAVGQKIYDERLDKIVSRARSGRNISYVHRAESPRVILRKLREGQAFGVLIDQDTAVEGVFAHFLGKMAFTPSGPVRMALRFNIPTFVVTTVRAARDKHRIWITPLALSKSGDFEKDVVMSTEAANEIIGKKILEYPLQWVWMHRRWRRNPGDPENRAIPSVENYA